MSTIRSDMPCCSSFPDLDGHVVTARSYITAIWGPGHSFYGASVAIVGTDDAACITRAIAPVYIPYSQDHIMPASNNMGTVGRPGQGIDRASMSMIGKKAMFWAVGARNLPYLYTAVKAARCNPVCRKVWRPGNGKYPVLLIMDTDLLSGKGLPHLRR